MQIIQFKRALRRLAVAMLVALLFSVGCSYNNVLRRIDSFAAPPYQPTELSPQEGYDRRVSAGRDVPPDLQSALIVDLYIAMVTKLKLPGVSARHASKADVAAAIDYFANLESSQRFGLRPWTHAFFIKSLDEGDRRQLAKEVSAAIDEQGVWKGVDEMLAERQKLIEEHRKLMADIQDFKAEIQRRGIVKAPIGNFGN